MKRKHSLLILLGFLLFHFTSAQVVINEVQYGSSSTIELKNVGSSTVDVSNWWLCYLFTYRQLSASNITVTGNTMMAPGDIVTISGSGLSLGTSSDLGIYNSSSFGSSTAMEDFVQWGAGGQGRESVAVTKGIWTAGDFVPSVMNANSTIEWNGGGDGSQFWFEITTGSLGSENIILNCNGGTVALTGGGTSAQVCLDGMAQVLSFDSTGTSGTNFAYVVTDNNGTILGLPPGDMVNFQPAGPGECWVWGLSYTGTVTAQVGDNATQVALSDGCFDLSDNFLVVFRDSVSGGNITDEMGNDSVFVCIDGTDQFVSFDSSNVVGPNFAYVITDDQGTILGLPPGDMANFAPAGPGICYVWGLSYTGNIIAMMGQNALQVPLTDGCFDLSDDFLVVARDSSNCTTSIEDKLPLGSVNIYPNPVQDLVTIELSQAIRSEVALLTIHDLTGREIYRAEWESIQDRQNVDTHKWDSGLYILTLQTDAGVFRSKIVKE
ncbi:MAG: T9SS type A sorting domain-containing protein [Bacteroidota bacterium]